MRSDDSDRTLISVIVPVYNVEPYVKECLESIGNQTHHAIECIMVNDGSTDGSAEICRQFAEQDKRFQLINQINGGLSSAYNKGIEQAKGTYLSFVDSDDWLAAEMIETMLRSLQQHKADIAVCGHFVAYEDSNEPIRSDGTISLLSRESALDQILGDKEINSFACDKIFKRELFESIRFPLGRIFADTATTYKVFAKAGAVVRVNVPLYYYRRRAGSLSLSYHPFRNYHNFLAFYERYEFARVQKLPSKSRSYEQAVVQAINAIDNYSLGSREERERVPETDLKAKIDHIRRESQTDTAKSVKMKLRLFVSSPMIYRAIYMMFHFSKKILTR